MKRLFIFTFCLLLFEVGYALDVPDFMMVPKSTWVSGFPELNKDDIQTEVATAAQDANLGLRLVHLKKSYQATKRASETLGENGVIESGDILLSFRPVLGRYARVRACAVGNLTCCFGICGRDERQEICALS